MKRVIKKNNVVVINQPKHNVLSLIVVGNSINEEIHLGIDKLEEYSDIVFVFSDKLFPSLKKIDKEKFSNLYQACAYIDASDSLGGAIFKALLYDTEIFRTHFGYMILNSDNIVDCNRDVVSSERLLKIVSSTLVKPIYKVRRLGYDELYEIYKKDESVNSLFTRFLDNFPDNKFSTYTSTSPILVYKRNAIDLMLKFWREENTKNYVESFEWPDCRYLMASLTRYLGIDVFNSDINNIDV